MGKLKVISEAPQEDEGETAAAAADLIRRLGWTLQMECGEIYY